MSGNVAEENKIIFFYVNLFNDGWSRMHWDQDVL